MVGKITFEEADAMARKKDEALDRIKTTIGVRLRQWYKLQQITHELDVKGMAEALDFLCDMYEGYRKSGMIQYKIVFNDGPIDSIVVDSKEGKDIKQLAKEALVSQHNLSENEAGILVSFKIAKIKRVIKLVEKNTTASSPTQAENETKKTIEPAYSPDHEGEGEESKPAKAEREGELDKEDPLNRMLSLLSSQQERERGS